jgi:hypothetical protein
MYLLGIFFIIVFLFYFQCYLHQPRSFQIIQTDLTDFRPDLLLEKQPIYLADAVVNPADLIHTIFRYLYIKRTLSLSDHTLFKQNLSKFVLIYNDHDEQDTLIKISHPIDKAYFPMKSTHLYHKNYNVGKYNLLDEHFVSTLMDTNVRVVHVILKPHHSLILPINWYYQTTTDGLLEVHLHDTLSLLYSTI